MPKYVHFSFDDVYQCLKDIIDHVGSYHSIFENDMFAWMKEMHDKYGAVFSLYTFNEYTEQPEYDISDLPDDYAEELSACSSWLKFGFHAKNDKKMYSEDEPDLIKVDYGKFVRSIMYVTGNELACVDRVVRLGFFAGSKLNVQALCDCEQGILGLLTADNDEKRVSYFLDGQKTERLNKTGVYCEDGILFLRSCLRMELVDDVDSFMKKMSEYTESKVIELFAHEYCLKYKSKIKGISIKQLCEEVIRRVSMSGYHFGFAQEVYDLE